MRFGVLGTGMVGWAIAGRLVGLDHDVMSIEALKLAGEGNLRGKTFIDISNPLDFSKGMPPTLSVSNTDSLGEQIQRAFPQTHVVKTLNTVNAYRAAAQFWMEGYCRHRRYHDRARPRDVSSHLAAPLGSCEDPDVQYKSRSLKGEKEGHRGTVPL